MGSSTVGLYCTSSAHLKQGRTMSASTATSSSGREQRLPPTSELSALLYGEVSPQHRQEKLPLSYVHIPSNQNGSSSGTSEISSITRLAYAAAATCGSPPTSLGDVSYSMFSSSLDEPPMANRIANPSTSTFRLEPKFGPNTKLRSNPPFWSSSSSTPGIRGRKRTAQSMALNNSNSSAITRSALASRPQRRTHPDNQLLQPPSNVRHNYAMTPALPRYVDSAVFNMQGLSLRSPASAASSIVYNNSSDFRTATNNAFVASPAATHSSFTACGSSSFSKVNTSFTSTATVDGTSPFRTYRSGSFGSALEGTFDMINDGMPPPASIEITSSSPRIVPLTVLTHDSVPTLQALNSADCHRRNLSFGSSATGARPPTQHAFALGMSPLLLSVGSSSTSDDCRSGAVPTTSLPANSDKIDEIFRDDHYLMARTPQRSRPPLSLVQYCPDSTHTAMSILADSPIAAFADHKSTPSTETIKYRNLPTSTSSVTVLPLPKVSLTPRSGLSPSNATSSLPLFPSPNSCSDDHQESTVILPKSSRRINKSIRIRRTSTVPSRDVSVLTEAGDIESCSLDLSVDNNAVVKSEVASINHGGPKISVGKRFNRNAHVSDTFPSPGAMSPSRKKELDRLSLTMTSTPSAVSNVSIKEMIIEMSVNRVQTSNRRGSEVDTESLSDGDDDEFFLAAPSSLVEEKQIDVGRNAVRQSKQPRLLHTDGSKSQSIRNYASMTSFGSQNTLLGTGFAMSNTSLRGMDASSNQVGMSAQLPSQHQSSLIFSECTGTSVNGCTMERVGSMASIGLDLDHPMERGNAPFVSRDLVTPPVMLEASQPPPLSPRFGSRKTDVWLNSATNDNATGEMAATASNNCLYYDSTKRTVA